MQSPIFPVKWTDYYSDLLTDPNSLATQFTGQISPDVPPWPPVSEQEILELIASLKSGKALGPGSVLASALFNVSMTDLPDHIGITEYQARRMNSSLVPLLLYADDTVLIYH